MAHGGVKTFHAEFDYDISKESIEKYISNISVDDDFGGNDYKDSLDDKHRMSELILLRTHRVLYISNEFPNIKDLGPTGMMKDFQTFFKAHQVRLDFDLKRKPIRESIRNISGVIDNITYTYANFDTLPFEDLEEYRKYRSTNEPFSCLRTENDWGKFFLKLNDKEKGYKRRTPDEWTKLFSVIQGYRCGLWSLPELEECKNDDGSTNVKKVITVINDHNHSARKFNETAWKNARRPERASQMLPEDLIKELLEEFHYIPTSH